MAERVEPSHSAMALETTTAVGPPPDQVGAASPSLLRRPHKTHRRVPHNRLLRDSIAFEIPMHVTAHVGLALRRTRDRRLAGLRRALPGLAAATPTTPTRTDHPTPAEDAPENPSHPGESTDQPEDDRNHPADGAKGTTRRRTPNTMPQRGDFGSMIDYLEAKYVQGVMLDEEEEAYDPDEGAGSVYSETSFLDDTDLRRNVAEQVLAQSTTTKVELMHDDAEEFFVNVGALEVEETELTQDNYDPLTDLNAPPKKRKRQPKAADAKAPDAKSVASNGTANGKKKHAAAANKDKTKASALTAPKSPSVSVASFKAAKKKPKLTAPNGDASITATSKNQTTTSASEPLSDTTAAMSSEAMTKLQAQVAERKAKAMHWYDQLVRMIQRCTPEDLPRRKTSERVAVTCPPDKHPGDTILFHNPHVPGQKLKVKVPKNTQPGGTFKVTVPVQEAEVDDSVDHNKLSRPFYDALDDYSRAYDSWCDAEAGLHKAQGNMEYAAHLEKRKKFDDLMKVFPQNLKTPVDGEYMKKLLRRARQSRSKREQALARKAASPPAKESQASHKSTTTKPVPGDLDSSATAAADTCKPGPTITVPLLSTEFVVKRFSVDDFERAADV